MATVEKQQQDDGWGRGLERPPTMRMRVDDLLRGAGEGAAGEMWICGNEEWWRDPVERSPLIKSAKKLLAGRRWARNSKRTAKRFAQYEAGANLGSIMIVPVAHVAHLAAYVTPHESVMVHLNLH